MDCRRLPQIAADCHGLSCREATPTYENARDRGAHRFHTLKKKPDLRRSRAPLLGL
jgi:hypothetical protein